MRGRALDAVFTHASQGVLLATPLAGDPERVRIVEANAAFQRHSGFTAEELHGRGLEVITGARTDERKMARLLRRAVTTACAIGGRFHFHRRDGRELHVELTIVPVGAVRDAEPQLLALLFRDVTERDELSTRLAHAERLAAVGALAAGLSHEVNSPLAAVLSHLQLLEETLPRLLGAAEAAVPLLAARAAQLEEHVEAARAGAEQVAKTVQSLQLLIATRSDVEPEALVELTTVVDSAIRLARPELRPRARLVRSYQQVGPVSGDAVRVQQAFLQLLLHVARALPEGDAHTREVRVTLAAAPGGGGGAVATIECRAADVAPESLAEGLGPSIIQTIVASYGGRLSTATDGGVLRFEIELPPAALSPALALQRRSARRGRVLIVDDDTLLLRSLRHALVEEHDVDTATGGGAALERLRGDVGYDLILCDVQMEGLSGIDVLETLRREAPVAAERLVFMTGGAATERAREYLAGSPAQCLPKPFELDHLRQLVRQRLREET